MEISPIFSLIILIISVIIHEISHGYMALHLGDTTAKYAGRLTLNPISHIDPIGSILVPIITSIAGFAFGWAKPVPYNPYNLSDQRWGEAKVAAAGPLSNIAIALLFGLIIRFGDGILSPTLILLMSVVVFINLILAIFNLVPIPPLDGSKILFAFLPYNMSRFRQAMEGYSLILFFVFIFFLWKFLTPVIWGLFSLITGVSA
ncbi:MAG: hypothetical protein A2928_01395 [Candidatus Taylorbacteria bacterium RIFCSPLOWO2_01_FULL_45_15b]|uniref:Peptidase M50 domain-containing protein n=1 Tax=Candidatus Taylorbacteria bacterium RIFCSPLOWO2_01_FULL_45_15b TaxID=1802319 RepID=A0A1G2N7N0_9BACT|nr:MAG: hypothetical protein A2928_01395 [Candidatus Taylorbacteria bacterium RIFCSPLOWO2_01_FULL_45_15b]